MGNGSDTQYTWSYDSAMNPMIHVDNVNGLRFNYEYDGIGRLVRQELRDSEKEHRGRYYIPGDLSKNGEKESHNSFIKELYRLKEVGILSAPVIKA